MSLFWLAYRQNDVACVMIVQAEFLILARLKASLATPGIDDHFVEGLELPAEHQDVPPEAIGRLLTQAEAHRVVKRLERQIPKKQAAPSVRRPARKAQRVGIKS